MGSEGGRETRDREEKEGERNKIMAFSLFFQALSGEVSPFMCSGSHVTQMDSHPSAIGAFLEGVLHCRPQPPIRSCVIKVEEGEEEGEEEEEEGMEGRKRSRELVYMYVVLSDLLQIHVNRIIGGLI